MDEKFGVENLKDICLTLTKLGIKIEEATSEGSAKGEKIALTEGVALLVFLIPKAISYAGDASKIKDELFDLSADELDEIKDFISEKLDLQNDDVEELVEAGLDWADSTNDLRIAVKNIMNKD
jgi:hypothetical protein